MATSSILRDVTIDNQADAERFVETLEKSERQSRCKTFKKQPMKCCICGRAFESDFTFCGGYVCSIDCKTEFEWRKTLYIVGNDYHERNQ